MSSSSKELTLGQYLADQRILKHMTLREVEQACNGDVSNAYLSQLEHDRISKPSPNILFSLASVYGVPYEILMGKAGYITEANQRKPNERHGRIATFANESLTKEEEEALLEYLAFLRTRSRKGSK